MSLVINKDRFTKVALSFVEPMQDYDKEEIVAETAIELARLFHNELVEEMPADGLDERFVVLPERLQTDLQCDVFHKLPFRSSGTSPPPVLMAAANIIRCRKGNVHRGRKKRWEKWKGETGIPAIPLKTY